MELADHVGGSVNVKDFQMVLKMKLFRINHIDIVQKLTSMVIC